MRQVEVEQNGFEMVAKVFSAEECARIIGEIGVVDGPGKRGLLRNPAIVELAHSQKIMELAAWHLEPAPIPVRGIYFDKSPDVNWLVAWHQDLTIAVQRQAAVVGFGPWSLKEGIPHVQPPIDYLSKMLTVRIHLDDADEENGALRVLPGSHRQGRLTAKQIEELVVQNSFVTCRACKGDVLLMRPLLLHASGRSESNRRRRILHIEYAGFDLPPPLAWNGLA
jgi:ectoine hydroxylase-related dioxygenase (phytanoyl-CoA dioxygenase family)